MQVGLLTNWLRVTGSGYATAAVKTDKTLWTWGQNDVGQLAQGNLTYLSSPKQVGSLTNWNLINGIAYTGSTAGFIATAS